MKKVTRCEKCNARTEIQGDKYCNFCHLIHGVSTNKTDEEELARELAEMKTHKMDMSPVAGVTTNFNTPAPAPAPANVDDEENVVYDEPDFDEVTYFPARINSKGNGHDASCQCPMCDNLMTHVEVPMPDDVLHNNVTQEDELVNVVNEGKNQYGFSQGHIVTPQGIVHVWQARNGTWYISSGYAMSENGVTRYWNGKTK